MNTHSRNFRIKLAGGLALGVSCLLYAAAVFIPGTQPTVLLGQYAMQELDLLNGDTLAYRPWFENGAWQGDIIEYKIDQSGVRTTDVAVGANPPTQGSAGGCIRTLSGCWSARASFVDNGGDDPTGSYWQSRNLFTHIDTVANPTATNMQIDFTWDLLSDTQRQLLDQATYATIEAAILATGDTTLHVATASDILNYVRGQRLHEKQNDVETGSLGDLRNRYNLLGDITGTPVYIGPPREFLRSVGGFNAFETTNVSRAGRIAVGANDGMLHVFDEDDGSEVYAYIPSMVLDNLGALAARDATYNHTYYVDGELNVNSAQLGATTPVWHTILTGGGGAGFEGLFALDVTDPAYTTGKLLFEKTGGNWGQIYGAPQFGFIGSSNVDPTWYIFTGNGYKTTAGQPTSLMMVNLDTFAVTEITTGTTGGLSAAVLLSTDTDDQAELAIAGDINGDLWMFEIDQTTPSSSIATKIFDGSPDQPIANAPTVAEHPTGNGYMVYFGTGSIFSLDDALNDGLVSGGDPDDQSDYTEKQTVYGLWLDTSNLTTLKASGNLPYDASDLQSQTLTEASKVFVTGEPAENVRVVASPNTIYYSCPFGISPCPTLYQGWKVDFPNCGERLVGSPYVRAGRIQFVTTNPTGPTPACGTNSSAGDSWLISLDYLQGSDDNKIVYNLNADGVLDSGDKVTLSGADKIPVALNLGPGNISQPVFTRLSAGVDKIYINGIQLPIEEIANSADIPGGHIDVVTDSPNNVPNVDEIAPNAIIKHSEGYDVQVNDGLGRAEDGLVHDYDGTHDVDFVDLFTLEPRRGLSSLLPALGITAAGPAGTVTCSTVQNTKEVLVTIGTTDYCIPAVEGELNRAYDILHQDRDGVIEPLDGSTGVANLQSEVNALNDPSAAPFTAAVPAKQFIVTLANADRSTSGTLQIGCKTWPVVTYQNMITTQLQDGRTTTSGLVDADGDSLIFTLDDIMNPLYPETCPGGASSSITEAEALAKGLSTTPTIRVGFGQRSILDEGIHATRSQCVLGLHDYSDAVCFTDKQVLSAAKAALAIGPSPTYSQPTTCNSFGATVPTDYIRIPGQQRHITAAQSAEGSGYRWRNGALTLQLLDAGINPSTDLQKKYSAAFGGTATYATMVSGAGTHAKAYTVKKVSGKLVITATEAEESSSLDESGLLYEAAMFWHYATLVDEIRNSDPTSNSTPQDAACYAGNGYNGRTTIDTGGLTLGEYQALTNPLVAECDALIDPTATCDLNRYFQLLEIIDSATSETDLNQALLELAELIDGNALLEAYHNLRDYVGDKIPEQHKLEGDKAQGVDDSASNNSDSDGTPADVSDVDGLEHKVPGPNFVLGRRNWIDIRQ